MSRPQTDPDSDDLVVVEVSSLEELFVAPAFDPWTSNGATEAGIDRLLDAARAAVRPRRLRFTVVVTGPRLEPDAAGRVARALARWCDVHIAAYDRRLAVLRRQDRAAFLGGGAWLVACLALAGVFDSLDGLPHPLRLLLADGLVIAAWVGMWKPVDILLYDRAEARRERRVLAALRDMPLDIQTHPIGERA